MRVNSAMGSSTGISSTAGVVANNQFDNVTFEIPRLNPEQRRRAQTARAQIPTFVGITPQEANFSTAWW
jgi:hypothetical protein